jgi:hypothetical protein
MSPLPLACRNVTLAAVKKKTPRAATTALDTGKSKTFKQWKKRM